MENKEKIIFFGTSGFAAPALKSLVENGFNISAVITSPDEPVGRKQLVTPSPVKSAALELGLEVLQPAKLSENEELLDEIMLKMKPDLGIVVSYGKIIPEEFIALFRLGILNIHPSLLPKYRGPSPIHTQIIYGEKETGVTIMKIDDQVDHGPVLAAEKMPLDSHILFEDLQTKLAEAGAKLLVKILPDYLSGKIKPEDQDHGLATFTQKITKDDGKIDWLKTAKQVFNRFRAFHRWPGIWTLWNGKILKLTAISLPETFEDIHVSPGHVFEIDEKYFIDCDIGYIELIKVQLEGKKELAIRDFLAGHKDFIGSKLG